MPTLAYVALGSNLGQREQSIRAALDALDRTPGVRVARSSSLLENPAVGGPDDSPPFLNAAAELHTTLDAHALLRRLLEIEQQLGRVRRERWEPRAIDLDVLLYGDRVIQTRDLIVPHPLMHARRFVLQPLAEIGPQVVHPVLGKTIAQLLAELPP